MATATPHLVRIEQYDTRVGEWTTMHDGWGLLDPQRYVDKINDEGKMIARAIDKTNGEVFATPGYEQETDVPKKNKAKTKVKKSKAAPVEQPVPDITSLPKKNKRKRTTQADKILAGETTLAEAVTEIEDADDFDDLAEFDQETETPSNLPSSEPIENADERAWGQDDFAALLDSVTDPYVPTIEESGNALFIGMPTTKDYIFDGHAGASPSGAERWINCTASLGAARAFLETLTPNQQAEFAKGSTAAREGTTAHAAAESEARLMLGEITDDEHDMNLLELAMLPDTESESYDDEMGEWLTSYGDLIRQFHQDGHPVLIEQRVVAAIPLLTVDADGDPEVHEIVGSADAISMPIPVDPVLTVADLKYGNGKNVEAEDNPQAMIYALAVLAMLIEMGLDIFDKKVLHHIDLIIIQPRLGGTKTWSITVEELLDWQDDVLTPALTQALAGNRGGAKFTPGETQCTWCPARGNCPALLEDRMSKAADLFDVIQDVEFEQGVGALPDVVGLDSARLADLLAQAEGLVKLKDELKAEAQRRLHRGEEVPGYQLVNYQPPRTWMDEAEVTLDPDQVDEDFLDPQTAALLWQRKILSPTQALKALKAAKIPEDKIDDLIIVPDKRPVVAKDGDRRSKWEAKPPEQMFEDETDTEV